jgi:hypothetical protein
MKNKKLIRQLKMFIMPHPIFVDSEEDIFTPRKGYDIRLWFEGGFQLEFTHNKVEINFNSIKSNILVFSFSNEGRKSILRINTKRIISFELLPEENSEDVIKDLYRLGNDRKN